MLFVKTNELTPGMRLAKPIYNKMGVLLYERDTPLTQQGIISVENFGLIGLFILEPSEPAPPITKDELEFEQFQTVYMFKIKDIMDRLQKDKPANSIRDLAYNIYLHYGTLDHKLHFTQNLRSSADYVYKHALSVAILSAMIAKEMHISNENTLGLVEAALLYDFGCLFIPPAINEKGDNLDRSDVEKIQASLERGYALVEPHAADISISETAMKIMRCAIFDEDTRGNKLLTLLLHILKVADRFDRMTAMNINKEPSSELAAIKFLRSHKEDFNQLIVGALANCIHILPTGACLDLKGGGKALVIQDNPHDFAHPMILNLADNKIYDLSDEKVRANIEIIDIMKTMDNRIKTDEKTLEQFVADEHTSEVINHFREKKILLAERRKERERAMLDVE